MNTHLCAIVLALLLTGPVWARPIFEIRSPLGIGLSNPTRLNEGLPEKVQVKELYTFGADALILPSSDFLPELKGWAVGLRFDSISAVNNDSNDSLEVAARLFSLLLQHRWTVRENIYVAPTATVGLYQPSVINQRTQAGSWVQFKANQVKSASFGAELGWISDVYLLGAELGYQYLHLGNMEGPGGAKLLSPSGEEKAGDLSHAYFKFLLGLHF